MSGFDGVENQRNGLDLSARLPQDPRSLLSSSSPCFPITLKFVDVCYRVKIHGKTGESGKIQRLLGLDHKPSDETTSTEERTILSGVTGMVSPGEFMAVLGPSGSGKSTLLNAIAGRLHGPALTGKILMNDVKPTKQTLKRTGFVAQDDLLYPHLTVRETLVFVALLRLPRSLTRHEKIKAAESVISELGLEKCENTVVGNTFIRGISGGERKRVSIAHELLINPSLLVLDEPTSGLDATAALRLVQTLSWVAHGRGKAVVTSIHQPSSRVFQMFDTVLLLSEGKFLFYGKGRDAMAYFESVGFSPAFPMNPADFLLDLANGELGEYGNNVTEGMMFRNREAFKQHMAIYAISMKFQYRSRKSEPGLMVLECCGLNCPWRVYAVKLKDADVFEVRKVVSEHTCSIDERGGYQTQATSSVIGELMRNKFGSAGGGPKPREIRQMMRGDHDVNISYWKAWRSRDVAIDKAKGTTQSSYHLLPDYLQRLVTANPGTITKLYTETVEGGGERFKYMFVAFGASIKGYEFMRKVVVVDGTHLKGKYAGCLLTASAQDGNYQIFPLAFAVVDSENDSSWEWFFEQLSAFVERDDELVFVSDRHMSIYKGLSKVYPGVGHCICVVHLKRNIRSNFRARHLEYLVAKAARTFRLQEFYTTFNEIKTMDPACAEYLLDIGLEHWARSHFPGKRYNIMTSNLAESWNSVLREAREFPVIPLIDFIRTKLTGWFATRREAAQKNMGSMSPKVSGMLTKSFEQTGGYGVTQIGEDEYEVRNKNGGSFHVDLDKKTCSCYEFQVLAIPCSHAIAAAIKAKISVESLVLPAYTIEGLRSAYAGSVLPVPDYTGVSDLVSDFGGMKLCPPVTRRPPGRPKKQRFFSRGEKIMKRTKRRALCSRCKGLGHNKATCKESI